MCWTFLFIPDFVEKKRFWIKISCNKDGGVVGDASISNRAFRAIYHFLQTPHPSFLSSLLALCFAPEPSESFQSFKPWFNWLICSIWYGNPYAMFIILQIWWRGCTNEATKFIIIFILTHKTFADCNLRIVGPKMEVRSPLWLCNRLAPPKKDLLLILHSST